MNRRKPSSGLTRVWGLQGFQFKLLGIQRDTREECEALNLDMFSGVGLPQYDQEFAVLTTRQMAYKCLVANKVEPYGPAGAATEQQSWRCDLAFICPVHGPHSRRHPFLLCMHIIFVVIP